MWTTEQKAAIDIRDSNVLVSAAAGSGKTAVLVERIIQRICDSENPVDIDRLLIVTFTNAAALEMRERIGDGISKRLEQEPNNTHIQKQLHLLQRSSISTIHSFCLSVIRKYFYQIDIDPVFRIGSEAELNLIKSEVLDEVLEELFEKGDIEFLKLADSYTNAKNANLLRDTILRVYTFAMSTPWPTDWLDEKVNELLKDYKSVDETPWAKILLDDIKFNLDGIVTSLKEGLKICSSPAGPAQYIDMLEDDLSQILEISNEDSFTKIIDKINKIKFKPLSRKREECDEDLKEKVKNIRDDYVKAPIKKIQETLDLGDGDKLLESIKETGYITKSLVDVIKIFTQRYQEAKSKKSLADYNDLEHYCLQILIEKDKENNTYKPSKVATELQEFYEEIYIDEYQDSNIVQETILKSISKENNNRFMVGDLKQSIYRFRLANPYLFKEKEDTYTMWESDKELDKSTGVSINLQKNFRSRAIVLDGINYIFNQIMSNQVGDVEYNDLVALNPGLKYKEPDSDEDVVGGPIEVHILEKNKVINELGEEKDNEVELIIRKIQEFLSDDSNYKIYDKDLEEYRRVAPRDIVILLRSTVNKANKYVERLEDLGIRAFADVATGYFETLEVKTVLALLSIIDNPRQDIPLLSVLRSPIVGLTLDEITIIRNTNIEGDFYDSLNTYLEMDLEDTDIDNKKLQLKLRKFKDRLDYYRQRSLDLSVDELLSLLIKDSGYYQYVSMLPGGEQKQANLRILKKHAFDFENSSYTGLFNFMNYIERVQKTSGDFQEAKIFGENEDLVRIMSIHKSKGLEFPIVFVANIDKRFNKQDLRDTILLHNEYGLGAQYIDTHEMIRYNTLPRIAIAKQIEKETISEEMRILYVALTRAKEKLILTGTVDNLEKEVKKWGQYNKETDKISAYNTMNANSFLDWIGPSILSHKDAGNWHKYATTKLIPDKNNHKVQFEIYDVSKEPIEDEKQVDKITKEELINWDTQKSYGDNKEKISNILSWQYPYKEATKLPVKMTVTEIKQRWQEIDQSSEFISFNPQIIKHRPKFIEDTKSKSPTVKGTMIHSVLQHLDLKGSSTKESIKTQIDSMIDSGKVDKSVLEIINISRLLEFANSDIVNRMNKSSKVYKEQQFVYLMDINQTNQKEISLDYKEDIMVQGVIDCFFEENDSYVLIDYKTDYIPLDANKNKAIEQIIKNYKKQVEIYALALEGITKIPVKERYLYLYSANEWVSI